MRSSAAILGAAGVLLLPMWFGACRRQPAPAPIHEAAPPAAPSGERAPRPATALSDAANALMSLPPEPALPPLLPLFADDPQHPWNRLHQALFARLATVKQTACLLSRSCDVLPTPVGFFDEATDVQSEYADTPAQLMLPGIEHLLTAARHGAAVQALQAARAVAPEGQPIAAALLQNDLWERFDAVQHALAEPTRDAASRAALRELGDGLGTLIAKLALPAAVIGQLPSNLPRLVQQNPDVLAGLGDTTAPVDGDKAEGPAWVELLPRSADVPRSFDPPLRDGTRHSMQVGYRAVFRIFASIPAGAGGAAWLRRELALDASFVRLPAGTRLAIYEQPLILSREGEPLPLPLVTLLESRRVQAPAAPGQRIVTAGKTRLSELPFAAFEGRRQLLRVVAAGQSGLIRLAPAAPFPQGGTCSPRPELLQPASSVCLVCHQPDTEHLTGTLSHGEQHLRLATDSLAAARAAIAEKRGRADFKTLLGYFAR